MAFVNGGYVITTLGGNQGKGTPVKQSTLRQIAKLLDINVPPTELIRTIHVVGDPDDPAKE
jgi:hypothetical protein